MSITIPDLNAQIAIIATLRESQAAAKRLKKEADDAAETAENKMLEMLVECQISSHRGPHGMAVVSHRTSVQTPKSPEDREAFFKHLKEKGLFDTMISVHSGTLNEYYQTELELAKERGDADFNIPGINGVTIKQNLSFRK